MTLFLIRLPKVNLTALAKVAAERGWTKGRKVSFDEGAALHHILAETFGPRAVQPFRLMVAPRAYHGRLYAYSETSPEELRDTASIAASPEIEDALAPVQIEAKPMPEIGETGRRIGFDLRVRPVVRLASDIAAPEDRTGRQQHGFRAGAEIDAFLSEALKNSKRSAMAYAKRSREAVYRDWLAARFGTAATIKTIKLAAFRRTLANRNGNSIEGPDAILHGTLTVENGNAFSNLLRCGVGRHRAYGYGMMLLRPPVGNVSE